MNLSDFLPIALTTVDSDLKRIDKATSRKPSTPAPIAAEITVPQPIMCTCGESLAVHGKLASDGSPLIACESFTASYDETPAFKCAKQPCRIAWPHKHVPTPKCGKQAPLTGKSKGVVADFDAYDYWIACGMQPHPVFARTAWLASAFNASHIALPLSTRVPCAVCGGYDRAVVSAFRPCLCSDSLAHASACDCPYCQRVAAFAPQQSQPSFAAVTPRYAKQRGAGTPARNPFLLTR